MRKTLYLILFLAIGTFLFLSNNSPVFATCTLNGSPVATGTQFCQGSSYVGNTCTSSTSVGTCQSTGSFTYTSCSPGTYCSYFPSSTNVSCLCNTVGCGSVCAPTPTPGSLPNCDSGKSCGTCSASCTQGCNYTTYSGGGSCNVVSAGVQSCTGGSCTASCGPIGTTQCYNGATGYCDTSHLYYQTCTAAGWSNSANCPAGEYPYAFGTSGAGCTSPCTGHGSDTCQSSCSSPDPNLTSYTNPNYAGCSAGTVCCAAAAPPVCTTCYNCSAGTCDGPHSITSGTCTSNGYSYPDFATCSSSCVAPPPTYYIAGNVYNDANKNGTYSNPPDSLFTSTAAQIDIYPGVSCSGSPVWSTSTSTGTYTSPTTLSEGQYAVCLTNASSIRTSTGYYSVSPSGSPPMYVVTVGAGVCSAPGSPSPCTAGGNIDGLSFGLNNSLPWMQTAGGDLYASGFQDLIPSTADSASVWGGGGAYASVWGTGQTPGIIYSGNTPPTLGLGNPSQNPPAGWIAGTPSYPETYVSSRGQIQTSFETVNGLIDIYGQRSSVLDLATKCDPSACDLGTLQQGIYMANQNITFTNSTVTGSKQIIILVSGGNDLLIKGKILVGDGSTLFVTVSGSITVDKTIGEPASTLCNVPTGAADALSTGCDVEGYYSSDHNFILDGYGTAACAGAGPYDTRLNIGGSVVVNALGSGGGTFDYGGRDLCASGSQYPVFTITERPDFILNSPSLFKTQRRIWQEVAP